MSRTRNSPRARRICFEAHKRTDHLGRVIMQCHICKGIILPAMDDWRADHIRRWAEDGEDTPDNLHPICRRCDETKAPKDTSEVAKGKRMGERHWGIKRSSGWGGKWRKKLNGEVVER